jgi:hypothetical protein
MTNQLIKYEAACRALAECKSVDEVKTWADKAAAMQAYGRMAKDKSLEVDAAEIRIRAERRLGEMLAQQKAEGGLNKGAAGAGVNQHTPVEVRSSVTTAPKLSDAGISKDLSSRAQKLAAVPEAEFEAEVGQWRERVREEGRRVSARLEAAGEREQKKQNDETPAEHHDPASPSLSELVDELQAENTRLIEDIKAMEADDLKAEALKWRRAYDHATRQQSEAMDRAKKSQDREKWTMRQLARCGKAVGEEDPSKIAAAVEAVARQVKKAA